MMLLWPPMADGLYLCAAQGADEVEPAAMGGQSYLKDVYEFEPLPKELAPDKRKHVIGTQACLWSEWTTSGELLEYMLYPRTVALAETAWTTPEKKNWDDFLRRLENHAGPFGFEKASITTFRFRKES